MFSIFLFRLVVGLMFCLLILPREQVHPRYYRTHFQIAICSFGFAAFELWNGGNTSMRIALALGLALTIVGSMIWSLEGAPAGMITVLLSLVAGLVALACNHNPADRVSVVGFVDDVSSSFVMGTALSAMLMGHSYLIAPEMSLSPLLRLIVLVMAALVLRTGVESYEIWRWMVTHTTASIPADAYFFLPMRFALGIMLPLGFSVMAWVTARMRSTQSATGILYVVVFFCMLGELVSQGFHDNTNYL